MARLADGRALSERYDSTVGLDINGDDIVDAHDFIRAADFKGKPGICIEPNLVVDSSKERLKLADLHIAFALGRGTASTCGIVSWHASGLLPQSSEGQLLAERGIAWRLALARRSRGATAA